jgi:hypothetical protein
MLPLERALRINQAIGRSAALEALITGSSASIGYSATCCRRLLTFSSDSSMSVPTLNSRAMIPAESWLSEVIFVSPSTLCRNSSCSRTISRSISCGLAPGQRVVTVIVGICTSGVSCIGMRINEMTPNSATISTPTVTLTGLWRNDWISVIGAVPGGRRGVGRTAKRALKAAGPAAARRPR